MGDSRWSTAPPTLEPELSDAYLQLIILGAYTDGELAPEERDVVCWCIERYVESAADRAQLLALARALPQQRPQLKPGWREERIEQAKRVLTNREHRERAFKLVVEVVQAHRGVGRREAMLLFELMRQLEIDENYASRLVRRASVRPPPRPTDADPPSPE